MHENLGDLRNLCRRIRRPPVLHFDDEPQPK
jgi:hypothetical protein